jgi:two-component system phosphate regulon sensor histidine kinase PhoR
MCFIGLAAACGCCIAAGMISVAYPVLLAGGILGLVCTAIIFYGTFQIQSDLRLLGESFAAESPKIISCHSAEVKTISQAVDQHIKKMSEPLFQTRQTIQDLNLQIQLLRRRKAGVEAILNSIHDAVIVVDSQERLTLSNPAAEAIFGFHGDTALSRPVNEILGQSGLAELIAKTAGSKVRCVRYDLTIPVQDKPAYFDCLLSCVFDDNGQVASIVAVLHDMTREKEASQAKNEFVSHVSHELKTPLASINAYAEMLIDGEAEDEAAVHQFCEIIQGQAQRLNRLIEEILNISRIESGMMKVNKQNHSLALIIRDAVEMIRSYAQEKNITMHVPPPIVCDQISADKDMIMQAVVNLLSNAVKYTPAEGQVHVAIDLNEVDRTIMLSVTDTGIGIPEEDIGKLFGKFYRVEANKNFAKGTGLGLNLVRQIVETIHGGKVFVRSKQGQGSTFGFILSLADSAVGAAS